MTEIIVILAFVLSSFLTEQAKVSPAEMRERLSKTCKLSDLQARLSKVKQFVDQSKIQQKDTKDSSPASSSTKAKEASSEKM